MPQILVVDDEQSVLDSIKRILLDEPVSVLTATSGTDALDLLQRCGSVRVVISDYRMPVMDGVEFLRQALKQWPDMRRVMLSGYTDSNILLQALNDGHISRYLVKPWSSNTIKIAIRELLDEYEAEIRARANADDLAHNNSLFSKANENLTSILNDLIANTRHVPVADTKNPTAPRQSVAHVTSTTALSPQERSVMLGIANGLPIKAIAQNLNISEKTVSTYKTRIFEKMGFTTNAQLIAYSIHNNLI